MLFLDWQTDFDATPAGPDLEPLHGHKYKRRCFFEGVSLYSWKKISPGNSLDPLTVSSNQIV